MLSDHPELFDGMKLIPCAVMTDIDNPQAGWIFIPHVDGKWVSAAKLLPFSQQIINYWLNRPSSAEVRAEAQEPVAWFAFSDSNGPIPLELWGFDQKACKHAVLENARSVGWKGTVEGYLFQKGWTIRPLGFIAPPPAPCPYCDDTGDVHSLDGEWRGECSCGAAKAGQEPVSNATLHAWVQSLNKGVDRCRQYADQGDAETIEDIIAYLTAPQSPAPCQKCDELHGELVVQKGMLKIARAERDALQAKVAAMENTAAGLGDIVNEKAATIAQQAALIEKCEAERNHARACYERAVRILTGIHALLYPPRFTDHDGRTWQFKSPLAEEQMQELSDRIRALPDEIEALDEIAAQKGGA